jgi:hypothetical protein
MQRSQRKEPATRALVVQHDKGQQKAEPMLELHRITCNCDRCLKAEVLRKMEKWLEADAKERRKRDAQ